MTANSVPISSSTSKPSSFGIWISRKSKSGLSSVTAFTASTRYHIQRQFLFRDEPAAAPELPGERDPRHRQSRREFFRLFASCGHCLSLSRKGETHVKAFAVFVHRKSRIVSIPGVETLTHVRKPHATLPSSRRFGIET